MKFVSVRALSSLLLLTGMLSCTSPGKQPVPVAAIVAPTVAPAAPACGDFLGIAVTTSKVTYKGCEDGHFHQLRAQIARYEVKGTDAKVVEGKLVGSFGMKPLKFACCGWESPGNASFRDAHDNEYEIQMSSGETTEKNWLKIPTFYVTVYKLLELP